MIDKPDGTRDVTMKVDGKTTGLKATQQAQITESKWVSPAGEDHRILSSHVTAELNGKVVHDELIVEPDPDPDS